MIPEARSEIHTLIDLIRWRAETHPAAPAFTFLRDGQEEETQLNYGELVRSSLAIATRLQQEGATSRPVLLPYPVGLDYIKGFLGCLMAGAIAVPVYPPRRNRPDRRLELIAADAGASIALTTSDIVADREEWLKHTPGLGKLRWIASDELEADVTAWRPPAVGPQSLAFLQYSSGSTGDPKGVMVSHHNLLVNLAAIHRKFGHSSKLVGVLWLPPYHDMGLIGAVLQPFYLGARSVLLTPTAFVQRPLRWLQAISKFRGTTAGGPNFAYDLCVRRIAPEDRAGLDLRSWEVAFTGSEPCRGDTLDAFAKAFEPYGFRREAFYPCYGLAEATLLVTGGEKQAPPVLQRFSGRELEQQVASRAGAGAPDGRSLVGCGQVIPDHHLAIVDPSSAEPCSPRRVGEIWVAGPTVAQGYWNRASETEATFRAYDAQGSGPFLRTGDLGFIDEGELYVTGRIKDVVRVRGRSHHPPDLELTAERASAVLVSAAAAAFSVDVDGEEKLVLAAEVDRARYRTADSVDIARQVREAIGSLHEIELHDLALVRPGGLPRTSSGKIQRFAARAAYLDRSLKRLNPTAPAARGGDRSGDAARPLEFSLFYFAADAADAAKYRLYLDGAKFADRAGFTAVWTPERHFHAFGGVYPNPSVLSAALAMVTTRIRLRAGSVVLPLHDPIRVAEEWAVVDNLSGGRVDLAFARGWNANDFVLAPSRFTDNKQILFADVERVRRLWRGESLTVPNGKGVDTAVTIHPRPRQPELQTWITCSGDQERFVEAGACGANVLTALLFQTVDELAPKIAAYRRSRALAGHSPGHVTLMLHTFVGQDVDEVRVRVRDPFIEYLRTSVDLWRHASTPLAEQTPEEREALLAYAFERYFHTAGLFGTPESVRPLLDQLREAGVDEIACLIDFGVDVDAVLGSLESLDELRRQMSAPAAADHVRLPDVEPVAAPAAAVPPARPVHHEARPAARPIQPERSVDPPFADLAQRTIVAALAAALRRDPAGIPLDDNFYGMGLDSLKGTEVMAAVGQQLGIALSPTMLFEAPTVAKLARLLAVTYAREIGSRAAGDGAGSHGAARIGDIAVIGFGCRMPMAPDPESFWALMRDGRDAVVDVPPDRWNWRAWYDDRPGVDGKTYSRWGGFLDRVDAFDPLFFKISAREARVMDPQQRLFLEIAWETVEHAGYAPDRLAGQDVGVFVGCSNNGYYQRIAGALAASDHTAGMGNQNAIIANRVSFALGLHGPSVLVDTMCSSSLVAVHLACDSLRRGECREALAGGVNLLLQPEYFVAMSRMNAHSADGRCRAFDHRANGIVLGEGAGAVLLKPLARAIADGDTIHAVIRGSAVNHGGEANGLSAPNPVAQAKLVRRAHEAAGVTADDISYVEAHGTGTPLGDPIEIEALTRAFRASSERRQFCAVGSVKTNIGHLEAAAGIAGLLKIILALKHEALPPHLHFERPNPLIDFEASPFRVNGALSRWEAPFPRRAAISSFGMGGTNAHVIVEQAPSSSPPSPSPGRPVAVLLLSAKSPGGLAALAADHAAALDRIEDADAAGLADYCFTSRVGRPHFPHRAAIVGITKAELRRGVAALAAGDAPAGMHRGQAPALGAPKVVLVFGGQGSHVLAAARPLYDAQPVFRQAIDRCERALGGRLGAPLLDLFADEQAQSRTSVLQPALFAFEWALAELWRSWGVEPHAAIGHSIGEYVAACVAGVFDVETGLLLAADRGRLMQELPPGGAMAAIEADEASVRRAIEAEGPARVSIAAVNTARDIVISGDADAVDRVRRSLDQMRAPGVPLRVSHAFHSARVDPILARLESRLRDVDYRRPRIALVSNVDGQVMTGPPTPAYWRDHARGAVRFADGIETLAALGCRTFVEIGPSAALTSFVRSIVPSAVAVSSLRHNREAWPALLDGLAALHVSGVPVDWAGVERAGPRRRRVPIPTSPFQRERHWIETAAGGAEPSHPRLGRLKPATAPDTSRVWEKRLDEAPPADGIDRILAAARDTLGDGPLVLSALDAGPIAAPGSRVHQTVLTRFGDGSCDVALWSAPAGAESELDRHNTWTRHARARVDSRPRSTSLSGRAARPDLSIMFFAGSEEPFGDKYRLVLSGAQFADRHGFSSVWVPERHFVEFGGLYPNPPVLHAALARETRRVQLRAGSVVLPLHDPLRVAEDWAVVDGLSGGRVGISFASGWNPDDFALAPDRYADRQDRLFDDIDLVRRLWRGETIERAGIEGQALRLRTYPTPVQRELPVWVSAAGNPRTFERAGEIGANLLTHLLDHDVDEVREKIARYRAARARAGHDPDRGVVTMMLHTFVGAHVEDVRDTVRGPFTAYLKTLTPLMRGLARSRNRDVDLSALTPGELDTFADFLFERFFETRALFGTPESCAGLVHRLHAIGVDEIACLLDFGPSTDAMLETLPYLAQLRERCQEPAAAVAVSVPAGESIAALQARGAALTPVDLDGADESVWRQGFQVLADSIGAAPVLTGLASVTLTGTLTGSGWLHAVADDPAGGDVRILDRMGKVIGEARGVRLQSRAVDRTDELDGLVYELRWVAREAPPPKPEPASSSGGWVVIGPGADVGTPLVSLLSAAGPCVTVSPDELSDSLPRALEVVAPCRGIVHLAALDAAADVTLATLACDPLAAVDALLKTVQALTRVDPAPRVWVVTRGAQPIAGSAALALAQSAIWGVGRTCALEHAEFWGGLIDLDPGASAERCAGDVLSAVREPQAGIQVGYRNGQRFVAVPERSEALAEASVARAVRDDRTYLVTGGLWGVGLEVVRWLVRQGARHLILVGRTAIPARERWNEPQPPHLASRIAALREFEAQGVTVRCPALDVADPIAFAAFLAEWRRDTREPIGGVIHAASVWQTPDGRTLVRPLVTLDPRAVEDVFRPKVLGGWVLHELLAGEPLDFFVCFSSAASLFGSAGQGNYAGAGAFLDALAHHRRAIGRPALSVNWGPISEVGFGATEEGLKVHEYWDARGIGRITPAQVVAALDRMLCEDVVQVGVLNMNWSLLRDSYPQSGGTSWIGALAGDGDLAPAEGGADAMRRSVEQTAPAERHAYLERHMHRQVALVLGTRPEAIEVEMPLARMGFDSLMAIEMRNRIAAELGVMLPIARFLEGPSVAELARYVLAHMERATLPGRPLASSEPWEKGTL